MSSERVVVPEPVVAEALRHVPVLIFAFDRAGRCMTAAGGALPAHGPQPEALVGRNLLDEYAEDAAALRALRGPLAGAAAHHQLQVAGTVLDVRLTPWRDDSGAVVGAVGVGVRATEQETESRVAELAAERSLARQRGLMLHLHEAQETERRRIAGEVHDDTIQVMAAVNLRLQDLRRRLETGGNPAAAAVVAEVNLDVRDTTDRLRRMLFELDAPDLLGQDLRAAMCDYAQAAFGDCDPSWRVAVDVSQQPTVQVSRVLFRICQEALANARKHAGAAMVEVVIRERDGGYALSVRDDGSGIPRAVEFPARGRPAGREAGHLGLNSMAERAESAGGWCAVRRVAGGGTLVEAWLPAWIGYPGPAGAEGVSHLGLLEQTMESISEGFAAIGKDWRYVYVNQVGADIIRRHDLAGKVCWDEFQFSEANEVAYRRAMAEQQPTSATVLYPDLGRWIESRVYPSPEGLAVFFRDVTEEHELEQQANERGRIIDAGYAMVDLLAGELELTEALAEAARRILDGWLLTSVEVVVDGDPAARVRVAQGEGAAGEPTWTIPLTANGRRVGAMTFQGPTVPPELAVVAGLFALRVAADRPGPRDGLARGEP